MKLKTLACTILTFLSTVTIVYTAAPDGKEIFGREELEANGDLNVVLKNIRTHRWQRFRGRVPRLLHPRTHPDQLIFRAITDGDRDQVRRCIRQGAHINSFSGERDCTPLSHAVTCCRENFYSESKEETFKPIICELLKAGANPCHPDSLRSHNYTPLHFAIDKKLSKETLLPLVAIANHNHTLNTPSYGSGTPLCLAVMIKNREAIALLTRAKAHACMTPQQYADLLFRATQSLSDTDFTVLETIVNERPIIDGKPVTVNLQVQPGRVTPLYNVIDARKEKETKLLIKAGASPDILQNSYQHERSTHRKENDECYETAQELARAIGVENWLEPEQSKLT